MNSRIEPATIAPSQAPAEEYPSFREALRFWLKLGFISFGGPTGQIAIMHAELVEKKRWISESRFLHALNYCMVLPGPEAQQLATYIGWLLHRTWGGIAAGGLFVLPSVAILWLLSYLYMTCGDVRIVSAAFYGLKPAVMAIVAAAVLRIGRKALKNSIMWAIAAAAFIAIFFYKVSFPVIIMSAGIVGMLGYAWWPAKFKIIKPHGREQIGRSTVIGDEHAAPDHARPSWMRSLRVIVVCGLLWWTPVALACLWLGGDHVLVQEGVFFSKAALVTFGGAYAVLPYVAQQAVERFGWMAPGQMLDGLGLAESTPGPLIMVVQFAGFVGAWNHPGDLPPLIAATLGALMTTWVTFLPCFLWIFLGAPYIERLRTSDGVTACLSAITAAVVGVVLNLAVWFGLHVLQPEGSRINWFAAVLAIAAFIGMVRFKLGVVTIIVCGALAGMVASSLGRNN